MICKLKLKNRFLLVYKLCFRVRVRLGKRTKNRTCDQKTKICSPPPLQDFRIETISIHTNYSRTTLANDIALIRLATSVNNHGMQNLLCVNCVCMCVFFSGFRMPVCLPHGKLARASFKNVEYALSIGWGPKEKGDKFV